MSSEQTNGVHPSPSPGLPRTLHVLKEKHLTGLRPRKVQADKKDLDTLERERLLRSYVPPDSPTLRSRHPVRVFLANRFYHLILTLIHLVFTLYNRARYAYSSIVNRGYSLLYHHHRTPQLIQKDVRQLERLPDHLSVILDYDQKDRVGGLDTLIDDVAEIACWCASAGIPMLSVYERTGAFFLYLSTSRPQSWPEKGLTSVLSVSKWG